MTLFKTLILLAAAFVLLACTPPGHYPVSGEECAEGDPVQDLEAADCTVPGM